MTHTANPFNTNSLKEIEVFCPSCGSGVPDGSKFCPKCGAPMRGKVETRTTVSPSPKRVSRLYIPVVALLLLVVGLFAVIKIVMPRIGSESNATETISGHNESYKTSDSIEDDTSQTADNASNEGIVSGVIEESMWDISGVSLSDATIERDKYNRIILHATATNDMSVDALFKIDASVELTNLSERFKSISEEHRTLYSGVTNKRNVPVYKDSSTTPSISTEVVRLAPHESTKITAIVATLYSGVNDEGVLLAGADQYDLEYGKDYQLSLTSLQAKTAGDSGDDLLVYDSNESDRDNEAIFNHCLQDVTCEVVSTDVRESKRQGYYDTTTVVRVRNNGSERHGVLLTLGYFDKDAVPFFPTIKDRDVSVTKGDGGLNWDYEYSESEACFGGEIEPGTEIEVTAKYQCYAKQEFSADSPMRITGMVPIGRDLSIRGIRG